MMLAPEARCAAAMARLAIVLMTLGCTPDGERSAARLESTSEASVLPSVGASSFHDAIVSAATRGSYHADGLGYRASARMIDDVQPPQLRAAVTITNDSKEPQTLRVKGCTVLLRAYRSAERAGTPAFFEAANSGWECAQEGAAIALAPGASRTLETSVDVYRVLDDVNPEGPYYFTVLLRRDDHALELPAGEAELSYGLESLRLRAETRLADDGRMLDVEVAAVNDGRRPVHVEYGACALRLRAFRTADRSGEPAWDSSRRPNPDPRTGERALCPPHSAALTLAPGDSLAPKEFAASFPVAAILGDSLEGGRYYLSASVRINHHQLADASAGERELVGTGR
jgi:hypothetical protein